jgi:hypothetical protein
MVPQKCHSSQDIFSWIRKSKSLGDDTNTIRVNGSEDVGR